MDHPSRRLRAADPNGCLLEAYRSRTGDLDRIASKATPAEQSPPPGAISVTSPAVPPAQGVLPASKGDTSMLVTPDDYPPSALRSREAGRVVAKLHVTAFGSVDGCDVTVSSGFADLDETTCRLLMRRSRYSQARDAHGAVTDAFVTRSVDWTIPQQ